MKPLHIILLLGGVMALQMTSFATIMPLFARRMTDFGAGVEALGISSMAYAVMSTLTAPYFGALADRYGRRPFILIGLAAYVLAFTGYAVAPTAVLFIIVRGLAGGTTAGLVPAVMGMIADLAPEDRKGQWIGIVVGGMSAGWIVGPVLGGALFDTYGYTAPFLVSILTAAAALATALVFIPETHTDKNDPETRRTGRRAAVGMFKNLPRPRNTFAILMAAVFVSMFTWTFIEPQLMFFVYDDLKWTSAQLGATFSIYGVAITLGEFSLARLSDRWGRKPVIATGMALYCAQFLGLIFFRDFALVTSGFFLSGLGNALYDPALNAALLDITPTSDKARVMGIKSMVSSLGNVAGPALVVVLAPMIHAKGVFAGAAILVGLVTLLVVRFGEGRVKRVEISSEPV